MLSTFLDGMEVLNEVLWMTGRRGVAEITRSAMSIGASCSRIALHRYRTEVGPNIYLCRLASWR